MRFSVLRLMLAVIPAAAAFAFLRWLGHSPLASGLLGAVIGGSLAAVVLVATKREVVHLVYNLAALTFALMAAASIVIGLAIYIGCFLALLSATFVFMAFRADRSRERKIRTKQPTYRWRDLGSVSPNRADLVLRSKRRISSKINKKGG